MGVRAFHRERLDVVPKEDLTKEVASKTLDAGQWRTCHVYRILLKLEHVWHLSTRHDSEHKVHAHPETHTHACPQGQFVAKQRCSYCGEDCAERRQRPSKQCSR